MFGAHTINEHIVSGPGVEHDVYAGADWQNADSVVELTRFYQAIILNFDQADSIA